VAYYVRVATRGSPAKGSPRQALNYITDGHDARRDASYSDAELHYIARMDPGWKTDLEGGRVPLVGFGELAGEHDEGRLAQRFEDSCQPRHDLCATTGYKSITLTVPKEVSLYAEGHREEAKAAINAAVKNALDRAFPGFRYSAVAAIHTRNQTGEIHYHVHVLVGKFAHDIETGRLFSLNGKAGRNGPSRVRDMKIGWTEGIDREFRERLKLGIEQKTPRSPVALVLPDGTRLEPLNRESRRMLEKELCPTFHKTTDDGLVVTSRFRWSAMDDRIFEIACGARGTRTWDGDAFKAAFPDKAHLVGSYEARVLTLKAIGYLSPTGAINSAFRVHFAARHGVLSPELQRVRIDLMRRLAKDATPKEPRGANTPLHPDQFWTNVQKYADLRHRIERLGYSKDDVANIFARAQAKKPTRDTLQRIRAVAESRAAKMVPASTLPQTKTILRAYVDLQKSKVRRIYLVTTGMIQFWRLGEKLALARQIKKVAERDLFFAKEKRIAQVGRVLRPVIWLVRVAMPREARRLDQAVTRCARLAYQQQLRRAGREAIQNAYTRWRLEHIEKPITEIKKQARVPQRPEQQELRPRLEAAQRKIALPDVSSAVVIFQRGFEATLSLGPKEKKTIDQLRSWAGREVELVEQVHRESKGEPSSLKPDEYAAAVRVGRVGNLLHMEAASNPPHIPPPLSDHKPDIERLAARLAAFRMPTPLTPQNLSALSAGQMGAHLAVARKVGLLDAGPAWTLKAAAARTFVQDVGRQLERDLSPKR
jgi:hypothetical protein